MNKFKFYNSDATKVNEVEVKEFPTFEGDKGVRALKDCIVAMEANMRQGNACAKMRGEVSGTGKKPWKQKGTGMARHGSKRSPIWVGGGVAHGPRPRDYSQKINKKVKRLGLSRALFDCGNDGSLALIESFSVPEAKTKHFHEIINRVSPKGSILIVDDYFKDEVILSARNLPRVYIIDAHSVNAWDLVRHKTILMSKSGFDVLLQRVNFQSE
ncbi:MAG: 50S ribosomal protein L4 [Verrucomicrobia bacterium]|nr:MAG: 50S ribosomal protein L4 [Verrucomicrobiota bacterium]